MNLVNAIKRIALGPEETEIPNLKRNDRCWCGSGKKYKACHLESDDRKRMATRSTNQPTSNLQRGF